MQSSPTKYEKYEVKLQFQLGNWLVTLLVMSAQQRLPTVLMLLLC